jgi:hypothetical protein
MRRRRVTAAPFALITSFFAIGISNVHTQTMFSLTNVALMRLGDA